MAEPLLPSQSHEHQGIFDKFADSVARVTARAWFFAACVALVIAWGPSFLFVDNIDTWQLLINTPTTVITFLLVGLAQNTTRRDSSALQKKLNALAQANCLLLETLGLGTSSEHGELRQAFGMERKESA
jgi:low affinity Fe/Cu permease